MKIRREFIRQLPKTDLHVHLDGSLRMETIRDLARRGVDSGDGPSYGLKEIEETLVPGRDYGSLAEYLKDFEITLSLMQIPETLQRIAYELAEDCAAENIRYVEVRFSPILHTRAGLKLPEVVESVIAGLKKAEADFNIRTGIIICGIRNMDPETSYRLAELAVAYKRRGVVGFDLAGEEKDFPAKDHREAFNLIINNNINSTVHAGEGFGPGSIAQAIHYCGANRIGHGTRLTEDIFAHGTRIEKMGSLAHYIRDRRIPMEMCLSSNVGTGAAASYDEHPFILFYRNNFRVFLSTDNRLMSATTLTREMEIAAECFGLELNDLERITLNAMKSAFIHHDQKIALIYDVIKTGYGRIHATLEQRV